MVKHLKPHLNFSTLIYLVSSLLLNSVIVLSIPLSPLSSGLYFRGESKHTAGSNIVISNGVLKRSSHWCIHGLNNSNIHLENLTLLDWETHAIYLSSIHGLTMKSVEIIGNTHAIAVKPIHTSVYVTRACIKHIASLRPETKNENQKLIDSMDEFLKSLREDTTSDHDAYGFCITGTPESPSHCVKIVDLRIRDVTTSPRETVSIATSNGQPIDLAKIGLYGVLRWEDAFDRDGRFNPNAFLRAQIIAALSLGLDSSNKEFASLARSILSHDEDKFFSIATPVFGHHITSTQNRGVFGCSISHCSHILLQKCQVSKFYNRGNLGLSFHDATNVTMQDPDLKNRSRDYDCYNGNTVTAFDFNHINDLQILESNVTNLGSIFGDVISYGFNAVTNVTMTDCNVSNLEGSSDLPDLEVNLPSECYGIRVQNSPGPIHCLRSSISNVKSPRVSLAASVRDSSFVLFEECKAQNIITTSSACIHGPSPKRSIGFLSANSHEVEFVRCTTREIDITGESVKIKSSSKAAGFCLSEDVSSEIVECSSSYIRGGCGKAYSILVIAGQNIRVERNICAWTGMKFGIGLKVKGVTLNPQIQENILFGHTTRAIETEDTDIPLSIISIGKTGNYMVKHGYSRNYYLDPKGHNFENFRIKQEEDKWILRIGNDVTNEPVQIPKFIQEEETLKTEVPETTIEVKYREEASEKFRGSIVEEFFGVGRKK